MRLTIFCFPAAVIAAAAVLAVASATPAGASPVLLGDFNLDGAVDSADYATWRDGLGDGYSVDDYRDWQAGFGSAGLAAASTGGAGSNVSGAPVLTATGVIDNGGINWSVFFTTGLPPSSIAVEVAIEVEDGTLDTGSVVVASDFSEFISGTQIINPGDNPFTGTITQGTLTYQSIPSVLDTGTIDGIFSPLGSTNFSTAGPHLALSFRTTGEEGFLRYSAITAQGGMLFAAQTGTVFIPEPASAAVLLVSMAGVAVGRRRAA